MYLGIDIGGTFIKYALIDENNNVVEKWKKPAEFCLLKCKEFVLQEPNGLQYPNKYSIHFTEKEWDFLDLNINRYIF